MLEVNRMYQGDSLQLLNNAEPNSIQLTVTSPPYYADKDYGDNIQNIENLATYEDYCAYLKDWFKGLFRVMDEDGHVCIVVDDRHTNRKTDGVNKNRGTHARMILYAEEAGFDYKDLIIWSKVRVGHASGGSGLMLGSYPYPPNIPIVNWFEYILIFHKPGKPRVRRVTAEQKEKSKITFAEFKWAAESIWKIGAERDSFHPCPYPKEIPRRLIKLYSFYGDTVLDPFMGSGTTAIMAKALGRNFIGFELNPDFCDMARSALTQGLLLAP